MSGGYFDYDQDKISYIADEVESLIANNEVENEWSTGPRYSPKVIAEFKKGLRVLREAFIYAQRIDWLVSCDDGEEQFHNRLEDELRSLK